MIKKYITPALFFFAFVALVQSCKHHPEKENITNTGGGTGGSGGTGGGTKCDPDSVYFNRDILPLLQSNCAKPGCHNANTRADGVQLTDYSNIINTGKIDAGNPAKSDLYEAITETDPDKVMPPPPATLNASQIKLIETWIRQGAKDNFCAACDTNSFKFSSNVKPIIDLNCKGCHSGTSPSGGLDLTSYANIASISKTKLLPSIKRQAGAKAMPPAIALSPCEITIIEKWINAGSKND